MSTDSAEPGPQLKQLGILEGHWDTHGTLVGEDAEFDATDVYEWMPGGFFLIHHVEAEMSGQPVRTLEVIGAHPKTDGYLSWSFDNAGGAATYTAALVGRTWSIDGEAERFRGTFSRDGKELKGRWEQRRDGAWHPWMNIVLRRRG